MAKDTRNFTGGKMNKELDERLVPDGQYIDALNIRVGSTENDDMGVAENSLGNIPLTNIEVQETSLSSSALFQSSKVSISTTLQFGIAMPIPSECIFLCACQALALPQ